MANVIFNSKKKKKQNPKLLSPEWCTQLSNYAQMCSQYVSQKSGRFAGVHQMELIYAPFKKLAIQGPSLWAEAYFFYLQINFIFKMVYLSVPWVFFHHVVGAAMKNSNK